MEGGGRKVSKPAPLKISRESRMIRKPPVPLPVYQHRKPVIIHTYSPKVIETDANTFMWLVQRLTGSSDTRNRCESNKPPVVPPCMSGSPSDDHNQHKSMIHTSNNQQQMLLRRWKSEDLELSEEESSAASEPIAAAEDDPEQQQQQFGVEQLLVSPTSSSDSGLFIDSGGNRICAAQQAVASPKSPLVSFDASGGLSFQFGEAANVFATSSALATNSSSDSQHQQHGHLSLQFPWSPIPTPNGLSHDILNDFPSLDLWTGGASSEISGIGFSPQTTSRLFGQLSSPAFQNMAAFSFVKDANSNVS